MKPKLCVWSSYYYPLKTEEAIERFIKNGIYAAELSHEHGMELLERSPDFIETGKRFASFIKERKFEISQGHLYLRYKICSDENAIALHCKWIDLYEAIGIKNMVLHCDQLVGMGLSKEEKAQRNIEKIRTLAEYIKDKDITICLENLFNRAPEEGENIDRTADDLLYIIDSVSSDRFGICLDTGHLNMTTANPHEFILKSADKLAALHIADNKGDTDQHLMPFSGGRVDFEEVVRSLREINYNGVFNLEIPGESLGVPMELRDAKLSYIKSCYEYLMR